MTLREMLVQILHTLKFTSMRMEARGISHNELDRAIRTCESAIELVP